MKDRIIVDIEIKSKVWKSISGIKSFVRKTCRELVLMSEIKDFVKKKGEVEILISLVSKDQIRKINRDFRNKDKPTDVLSFPFIDENLIRKKGFQEVVKGQEYLVLGDIVLSLEVLRDESLKSEKNFYDHLAHLLLHSILHLIGYDHENEEDAKKMEEIEIKILKKMKIDNPYK